MLTHANFLHAIMSDTANTMHREVYADWLEEQGDVRAELIRLALLIQAHPAGRENLLPVAMHDACQRYVSLIVETTFTWIHRMDLPLIQAKDAALIDGEPVPVWWWEAR